MLIAKYSHERFDNIGYYFHNHCEAVSVHINTNYYIWENHTKCSMRNIDVISIVAFQTINIH